MRRPRVLGRFRDSVWRLIVLAVSLVEVPLFLLRNRAIFRNRLLMPFWHWSFGHAITGVDYASRLYWPHRISLLYIPHPSSNPYLPRLFAHNVDVFTFESALSFRSVRIDMPRFVVLRLFTLLVAGVRLRHYVVERLQVYRSLSLAEDRLMVGRPDTDQAESVIDYTGYIRLLRDGVGRNPELPADLAEACRAALAARYPELLERPFVALVRRTKGRGLVLESALRDAGPEENYVPAVRLLAEHGYAVVTWGEVGPALRELEGVYTLEDVEIDRRLLNLYVFSHCAFFVGQQSGGPVLANACGVPCVIVDAFPHSHGTFRGDDIVLYKRLRERAGGRVLSLVEIHRDHPDLALGYNLAQHGVDLEPNTPEEILDAVQEGAALASGTLRLSEDDELLAQRYRALVAPHMHLAYMGNRTTLSELRAVRDELLASPAPAAAGCPAP
jgi:putative glycosyltransferase (TIGR04372 family)